MSDLIPSKIKPCGWLLFNFKNGLDYVYKVVMGERIFNLNPITRIHFGNVLHISAHLSTVVTIWSGWGGKKSLVRMSQTQLQIVQKHPVGSQLQILNCHLWTVVSSLEAISPSLTTPSEEEDMTHIAEMSIYHVWKISGVFCITGWSHWAAVQETHCQQDHLCYG